MATRPESSPEAVVGPADVAEGGLNEKGVAGPVANCGFAQEVDYGVGYRDMRRGHLIRGSLARCDGGPAGVTFDEASQRISGVFLKGRKVAEADCMEVKLEEFLQGAHSLLGRVG